MFYALDNLKAKRQVSSYQNIAESPKGDKKGSEAKKHLHFQPVLITHILNAPRHVSIVDWTAIEGSGNSE